MHLHTDSRDRLDFADSHCDAPLVASEYISHSCSSIRFKPGLFACYGESDRYWVKVKSSNPKELNCSRVSDRFDESNLWQRLACELFAGRLGARIGIAPKAHIVKVGVDLEHDIIEGFRNCSNRDAQHNPCTIPPGYCFLVGTGVGTRNLEGAVGTKDNNLDSNIEIDTESWLHTIVFRTWVGSNDHQGLIHAENGRGMVYSFDHESALVDTRDDAVNVAAFEIRTSPPKDKTAVRQALERVYKVSLQEIYEAFALPSECSDWLGRDLRLSLIEILLNRRSALEGQFDLWLNVK